MKTTTTVSLVLMGILSAVPAMVLAQTAPADVEQSGQHEGAYGDQATPDPKETSEAAESPATEAAESAAEEAAEPAGAPEEQPDSGN